MLNEDLIRNQEPLFQKDRPSSHLALQTQSQILKAALSLFNEHGATRITTHAIAEQAGISPGNLYYHFKNKEEIIRTLFWQMDIFLPTKWAGRGPLNPKEGLTGFMRFCFGELSRYQFFFREFASLLRSDPLLAKLWRLRYEQLFDAMRSTARLWVEAGILKPFKSPVEIDAFIENFWTLANFSGVHLDNRQPADTLLQPQALLVRFLYPYHTDKGQRVLDLYLSHV
ncbi:MAG TPA: TetR/AcrR family transcriptional regulator [Oligoflexus sp.]|uniref:TetR/AcrR family transcriptional regulator n=1 Tax=Oligoflexus sp. TaxID=1971216 RepID=UPI002D28704E|nr:TetR/AcrR family transcriptional regulator [Oligoflexus sp.]HYX35650.1 TetR/AcrR family transcriptional regulator [Oligoflexus sp.]